MFGLKNIRTMKSTTTTEDNPVRREEPDPHFLHFASGAPCQHKFESDKDVIANLLTTNKKLCDEIKQLNRVMDDMKCNNSQLQKENQDLLKAQVRMNAVTENLTRYVVHHSIDFTRTS